MLGHDVVISMFYNQSHIFCGCCLNIFPVADQISCPVPHVKNGSFIAPKAKTMRANSGFYFNLFAPRNFNLTEPLSSLLTLNGSGSVRNVPELPPNARVLREEKDFVTHNLQLVVFMLLWWVSLERFGQTSNGNSKPTRIYNILDLPTLNFRLHPKQYKTHHLP